MLQASVNELSAEDQKTMLEHTPVPDKRERWRVLTKGGYSTEQLDSALDSVIFTFGRMDDELRRHGPWLAGGTFSLGDISMLAIAHRISEIYPNRLDRLVNKIDELKDHSNRTPSPPPRRRRRRGKHAKGGDMFV